ncbi:MAG: hypothetical protein LUF32_06395, partial [Clostridiales bacterium]|nr:hypothetical protein [Clostridiales bacterium]
EVLIGDWDGDGIDTLCVRRGNTFYFSNMQTMATDGSMNTEDFTVELGSGTDEILVGDWDGDGLDTLCVRSGNTYSFINDLEDTDNSISVTYGKSSYEVLAGDWDADGVDTLCVRHGNIYMFQENIEDETAYVTVTYGKATDEYYAGKWF